MTLFRFMGLCATAVVLTLSSPAQAAPTGAQICKKMISDGRANGQTQQQCLCRHAAADSVLDDDIKTLLFDAWYTGTNNMAALEALPNPRRVQKQMRSLSRKIKKTCS